MNRDLATPPTTDPGGILQLRDRQFSAELIATALLHFDLFTWMDERNGVTTDEIATEFGFASRPLDVLLTLCRAYGYLTTTREGQSHLTATAREHLVAGSPWFLGPYFAPIRNTPIVDGYLSVLTTGKPGNWQAKSDGKDWHESMLDPEFANEFTGLMNSRGLALGQSLAAALTGRLGERRTLLDVAGGSGIYSATLVATHPQLSATILEQAPVDAIARSEILRHHLEDRVQVKTGDMFAEKWPISDIVLLSNMLHDWDLTEVRKLIAMAAEALPPGGLLVIHDAFISDDKSGPLAVAEYSALLMNITQGKCYTPQEYGEILADLRFEIGEYEDTIANRGFMTAVRI